MGPAAASLLCALLLALATPQPAPGAPQEAPADPLAPLFAHQRLLAARGQYAQAAASLEAEAQSGLAQAQEARYLAGVFRLVAQDLPGAEAQFNAVWEAGGPLAGRALLRLHRLRGAEVPAALWQQQGALRPRLLLDEARRRLKAAEPGPALELLTLALSGPLTQELRSEARLAMVETLLAAGRTLEAQELAAELLWCKDPRGLALLPAQGGEFAGVLRRLLSLMELEGGRGGGRGLDAPGQRLAKAVKLMEGKEGRQRALEILKGLEPEAATDEALRVALTYYLGRCLEMLDRDLEAWDQFSPLASWTWRLPFRTSLLCRMGRLALREGFPGRAEESFLSALLGAVPGESVAEATWLLGWTRYLGGDRAGALQMMRLLRSRWFTSRKGPFEHYGPMGVYWEARILESEGRGAEAQALWTTLAQALPVSFYGVLAASNLATPPAPPLATWDLGSSVTLAPTAADQEGAAAAWQLWRVGLFDEALEEVRYLLAEGRFSPFLIQLHGALTLRLEGDPAGRFRRDPGLMAGPWNGLALFWASVLPLAHLEVLQDGQLDDQALVAAVIRFESSFNAKAISRVGAGGLMQLKPGVAGHLANRCLGRRLKKNELGNPASNVTLGTVFLRELLKRHAGNWLPALAAYNAGPGVCSGWLGRFAGLDADELLELYTFPNTMAYVKKIVAVRDAYFSLYWPQLGRQWSRPGLARSLPPELAPYLDEEGGGCD